MKTATRWNQPIEAYLAIDGDTGAVKGAFATIEEIKTFARRREAILCSPVSFEEAVR